MVLALGQLRSYWYIWSCQYSESTDEDEVGQFFHKYRTNSDQNRYFRPDIFDRLWPRPSKIITLNLNGKSDALRRFNLTRHLRIHVPVSDFNRPGLGISGYHVTRNKDELCQFNHNLDSFNLSSWDENYFFYLTDLKFIPKYPVYQGPSKAPRRGRLVGRQHKELGYKSRLISGPSKFVLPPFETRWLGSCFLCKDWSPNCSYCS